MEADIVRMIGLMDEARRQMERDQADIDQIKSETNLLKVEIRAVQADTCALLTTLKAAA